MVALSPSRTHQKAPKYIHRGDLKGEYTVNGIGREDTVAGCPLQRPCHHRIRPHWRPAMLSVFDVLICSIFINEDELVSAPMMKPFHPDLPKLRFPLRGPLFRPLVGDLVAAERTADSVLGDKDVEGVPEEVPHLVNVRQRPPLQVFH